ncbi:hypothetical protein PtA15_3A226 [Puccinia triticina]|nr:uncharacterized protein PtA15_3A226 [Puccinia triticina]WAQ82861.1 hypothetical protein PtA15_3A226 [Puccinia triticina]
MKLVLLFATVIALLGMHLEGTKGMPAKKLVNRLDRRAPMGRGRPLTRGELRDLKSKSLDMKKGGGKHYLPSGDYAYFEDGFE